MFLELMLTEIVFTVWRKYVSEPFAILRLLRYSQIYSYPYLGYLIISYLIHHNHLKTT